ncbi:alpha/beta hydrolase [Amycolatopsis acidiphila]|uniref:Alpha/beta hydrolase n=1 Tax=Amycolatopsis acidiphila TaxID=715473 RepID=A0A558AA61_9PSEU|nr:alpha/beta hydrolase [Amycolatopsis acidiphila]TVT21135.1 alpha/beta hydrolase [Amycolatopsis acidiphila]UIJ57223.1 alpha/beta hydrolase [Amycolatopsis acidiphila]GHG52575.1 putative hydrolase (alpha/beta fold) [Amycolatopsis acidiphila]
MTDSYKESVYFLGEGGRLAGDCWMPESPARGTILLLHGGGQTRHSWGAAGSTLAGAGWTTFAVDSRGHGDSDWAVDGRYGLDAIVEDATNVVQAMPEPPVVIGASLGGLTGLVLAGEQPATIRGLVLVDAVPRIEPAGAHRIAAFMRSAPDGFGSLEEVADAIREYQPQRSRPVNLQGLRKNVRRGSDGRWRWHWDPAFLRPPEEPEAARTSARIRAAAARVQAPTLLVRGALSDVVTEEGAGDLQRLIPHAQYVDVAGTGHMVAGDDNSVFLTEVSQFLDELGKP